MKFVATFFVLALSACQDPPPPSMGPGCHYVSCGDMLDGYDGPRCLVAVDGRSVGSFATGQEAFDFIQRNHLHVCNKVEK